MGVPPICAPDPAVTVSAITGQRSQRRVPGGAYADVERVSQRGEFPLESDKRQRPNQKPLAAIVTGALVKPLDVAVMVNVPSKGVAIAVTTPAETVAIPVLLDTHEATAVMS
jgi:hypothetical protein